MSTPTANVNLNANNIINPAIPASTTAQITSALLDRYSLPISPTYLSTFLSTTRQPLPPLQSLISTLHFRLLTSDITASLAPTHILPSNVADQSVKDQFLPLATPLQILDIVDVGASRYAQLETLEMVERGEMIKGREVVRMVDVDGEGPTAGTGAGAAAGGPRRSNGPFKLLLQDAAGAKVHAFTVDTIPKIGMPIPMLGEEAAAAGAGSGSASSMCIGCKLVVRKGTIVRRGVVMLQAGDVNVLGGKVDGWDKQWGEMVGRKKRLQDGMDTV